jgi:hypothetical protein
MGVFGALPTELQNRPAILEGLEPPTTRLIVDNPYVTSVCRICI